MTIWFLHHLSIQTQVSESSPGIFFSMEPSTRKSCSTLDSSGTQKNPKPISMIHISCKTSTFKPPAGRDLWEQHLPAMPSAVAAIDDDSALGGSVPRGNSDVEKETIFTIAEKSKSMTSLTMLGETSFKNVDFFANTWTVLGDATDGSTVLVRPTEAMLIVDCCLIEIN